jgi:ribosomal protein S18 acetylase RimI-like enzyme
MNLSQREAQPEDEDFLYELHKAAMQQYITAAWGSWDESDQREQFHQCYRPDEMQVIQLDGSDVGVIHLQERTEEIFMVGIEVLPEFQNKGIGSQIIRQVMQKARQSSKPVALQVLKVNLAARALYQRLGFGVTGENDTHYILAYEGR